MSTPPPVWPPQPGVPSPFSKPPPRKSNPALLIILGVIACVIIGVLYWVLSTGALHHGVPISHP